MGLDPLVFIGLAGQAYLNACVSKCMCVCVCAGHLLQVFRLIVPVEGWDAGRE